MYTPKYISILERRREELRGHLGQILSGNSTFLLEVGCGHGHFLTAYAAAHPERTCVGIDLLGERIERALKKRDRARLGNLHFVQAEARLFIETLPSSIRVDTAFVLFPDPWPKLRHNKHRIVQPSFLAALASRATPGCPLYFRTDFEPYFVAAREAIDADPYWRASDEPWPFEFATVFQQRAPSYQSLIARCHSHPSFASATAAASNRG